MKCSMLTVRRWSCIYHSIRSYHHIEGVWLGSSHNGIHSHGNLCHRFPRPTVRNEPIGKSSSGKKTLRFQRIQGFQLQHIYSMFICHLPRVHRAVLLYTDIRARRAWDLENLRTLYFSYGHWSIVFWPSRSGRNCTLHWATSLLVLLRTDFWYLVTLLDGGE